MHVVVPAARIGDCRVIASLGSGGMADVFHAVGDRATSVGRSRERARAVARELEARGITPALVDGYGGALPLASSATEAGRERDRRVEVWLATP